MSVSKIDCDSEEADDCYRTNDSERVLWFAGATDLNPDMWYTRNCWAPRMSGRVQLPVPGCCTALVFAFLIGVAQWIE